MSIERLRKTPSGVYLEIIQSSPLDTHDHPCVVYSSEEELKASFVPYFEDGLQRGERCIYFINEHPAEWVLQALREYGFDPNPYLESGALQIVHTSDAHLKEGFFGEEKMLGTWNELFASATTDGFKRVRCAVEMTWALSGLPGCEILAPYEARLTKFTDDNDVSVICMYNRAKFSSDKLKAVIHAHPQLMIGNDLMHNPAAVPPDMFEEDNSEHDVQALLGNLKALKESLHREQLARMKADQISEELRAFLDNATEGLHWVGEDGTILWANKAELDLLGYTQQEYVGRKIWDFHVDPHVIEDILTRLKRSENLHNCEARLRAKDGSEKVVLINSSVLWKDGKFMHTQCFTRDITDMRALHEQVSESEKIHELNEELQELARIVSHELQEPIGKIRSYLKLLSVRYKDRLGEDANEFIDICSDSAKTIHRMIDDLWVYARATRLSAGEHQLQDVEAIVNEVVRQNRALLRELADEVVVHELPQIICDQAQIKYVFNCLIHNALTYRRVGRPPRIEIRAIDKPHHWLFSVTDNGTGIDSMYFKDIFRMFYRINERPGDAGTGMGLATSKKIVEAHDGRMFVESTLGEGSTFSFTIRKP
jgi:chemotaxis family two-component system sensor kinase Cph1